MLHVYWLFLFPIYYISIGMWEKLLGTVKAFLMWN